MVTKQVKGELNWRDITGRVVSTAEERSEDKHKSGQTKAKPKELVYQGRSV